MDVVRALLPETAADTDVDVDVHSHYATGWLDAGGVRANFVAAADGAVAADGRSEGLQTPGDNRVFGTLRDLADVVMVGAGTARDEDYGPATPSERRRGVRRAYGLAETLPVALLSRSLSIDPAARVFGDADVRTIVLTHAAADPGRRARLAEVADVIDCGDDTIEPARVRAALADRGHTRVLFEGGPTVFAGFAEAGAVDELCLSVSPLLGGPGSGRITGGAEWDAPRRLELIGLLEDDGALFCRYRVR